MANRIKLSDTEEIYLNIGKDDYDEYYIHMSYYVLCNNEWVLKEFPTDIQIYVFPNDSSERIQITNEYSFKPKDCFTFSPHPAQPFHIFRGDICVTKVNLVIQEPYLEFLPMTHNLIQ